MLFSSTRAGDIVNGCDTRSVILNTIIARGEGSVPEINLTNSATFDELKNMYVRGYIALPTSLPSDGKSRQVGSAIKRTSSPSDLLYSSAAPLECGSHIQIYHSGEMTESPLPTLPMMDSMAKITSDM